MTLSDVLLALAIATVVTVTAIAVTVVVGQGMSNWYTLEWVWNANSST